MGVTMTMTPSAWVFAALALIGLVLIIVVVVRILGGGIAKDLPHPTTTPGETTALDLLALRYARGEIDTADFQARLRELRRD